MKLSFHGSKPRPTSAGPMDPLDILVAVLSGVPVEDLKPKGRGE